MFTAPAMWNQILRINRLSPALPVTQLLQNQNYQSAAIPLGPALWNKETLSIPPGRSDHLLYPYQLCLPREGRKMFHWGAIDSKLFTAYRSLHTDSASVVSTDEIQC